MSKVKPPFWLPSQAIHFRFPIRHPWGLKAPSGTDGGPGAEATVQGFWVAHACGLCISNHINLQYCTRKEWHGESFRTPALVLYSSLFSQLERLNLPKYWESQRRSRHDG